MRVYLRCITIHAGTVALVLNLQTGNISSQFHLVFEDNFETVESLRNGTLPSRYKYLVHNSYDSETYFPIDDVYLKVLDEFLIILVNWSNNFSARIFMAPMFIFLRCFYFRHPDFSISTSFYIDKRVWLIAFGFFSRFKDLLSNVSCSEPTWSASPYFAEESLKQTRL